MLAPSGQSTSCSQFVVTSLEPQTHTYPMISCTPPLLTILQVIPQGLNFPLPQRPMVETQGFQFQKEGGVNCAKRKGTLFQGIEPKEVKGGLVRGLQLVEEKEQSRMYQDVQCLWYVILRTLAGGGRSHGPMWALVQTHTRTHSHTHAPNAELSSGLCGKNPWDMGACAWTT